MVTEETGSSELERIFDAAPFIQWLGLRLEAAENGNATSVLSLNSEHLQQDGFVHAGVLTTVADHTAGAAAATLIRPNQWMLSAELKMNFLRPASGEMVYCTSEVTKAGSRLSFIESRLHTGDPDRLVATAMVTIAVIEKES